MTTHNELAPDRHQRMHLSLRRALEARSARKQRERASVVAALKDREIGIIRKGRVDGDW